MAKPNAPKDIKPKTDEEKTQKTVNELNGMKLIIINLATTLLICIVFVSVNYLLQDKLLSNKFAQQQTNTEEENIADEGSGEEEVQRGIIVDLGDFILNLSDVSPRKYLKVEVALELTKKDTDPDMSGSSAKSGGHGEEGAAVDPTKVIEGEMSQFKPAIRDAVITTLSSKSAAEVSTVAGKELAKEQIIESVNGILAGDREVIRVSFGQFIIQ